MLRRAVIPHAITASRIVVVAAAYVAAWQAQPILVVALALLAVGTDMLDGVLARRWKVESVFGANLDSAADFVFYLSLVAWVWILDRPVIDALAPWIVLFTTAYVATLAISKLRRGAMGFHNFWTRTAATIGVVVALATLLWGWQPWFLYALLLGLTADLGQRLAKLFGPQPSPALGETAKR